MEPATLYILFQLTGGASRAYERPFHSVEDCERFVANVARPAKGATVERYECVPRYKLQSVPSWFVQYEAPKRIHGVPLAPELRP